MNIEPQFHALIAEIKRAGSVAHDYFVSDSIKNEQKNDGSVVTEVDKSIEHQLRAWIDREFPDDAIIGEEEEGKKGRVVLVGMCGTSTRLTGRIIFYVKFRFVQFQLRDLVPMPKIRSGLSTTR